MYKAASIHSRMVQNMKDMLVVYTMKVTEVSNQSADVIIVE